jgi:hypothetical protein
MTRKIKHSKKKVKLLVILNQYVCIRFQVHIVRVERITKQTTTKVFMIHISPPVKR